MSVVSEQESSLIFECRGNPLWLSKQTNCLNIQIGAGTHKGHPYDERNNQTVGAIPCGCPKQTKQPNRRGNPLWLPQIRGTITDGKIL